MILSDNTIRSRGIVHPCEDKGKQNGMSFGLSHCGYDVRADIAETPKGYLCTEKYAAWVPGLPRTGVTLHPGQCILIAVREKLVMPDDVCGIIHPKSTWARQHLHVQAVVAEPGWVGILTLALYSASNKPVTIHDGDPIAQVVFHQLDAAPSSTYDGKYQHQQKATGPRFEE